MDLIGLGTAVDGDPSAGVSGTRRRACDVDIVRRLSFSIPVHRLERVVLCEASSSIDEEIVVGT